jgi:hypothetical protein
MEKQQEWSSQEEQQSVDYDSDKSPSVNSVVSDSIEKDNESQAPEKDLSTFRLVLILAALWVCPMPHAP